jgi:hypothetical protein
LALFVRIGTFQWVTANPNKKDWFHLRLGSKRLYPHFISFPLDAGRGAGSIPRVGKIYSRYFIFPQSIARANFAWGRRAPDRDRVDPVPDRRSIWSRRRPEQAHGRPRQFAPTPISATLRPIWGFSRHCIWRVERRARSRVKWGVVRGGRATRFQSDVPQFFYSLHRRCNAKGSTREENAA